MHPLLAAALVLRLGTPHAQEPLREPQLAANSSMVGLVYGSSGGIYFRRSGDAGRSFSAPVKVATGEVVPLNRHRGPRIAFSGKAVVISAVVGKTLATGPHAHGLPTDGDLCVWRSEDQGRTWSSCIRVNDFPGAPTEGLHTLAAGADGKLFAAWLDRRAPAGIGGDVALYGAQSTDGGRTWSANTRIYASPEGTICQCCHPTAIYDAHGELFVMFRNWLAGSRDMYLARSRDGAAFQPAQKSGGGTWKLNACPMDGGGLAASPDGITAAWRREKTIYLARPGRPEIALGVGIDVSLSGAYALWTAPNGIAAWLPNASKPVMLSSDGSFPNVAALPGGGALAAWESQGQIAVQRLAR